MIDSQYIVFYISGLLMLLLIGLLVWYARPKLRNRKREQENFKYSNYLVACAGSPKGDEPREEKALSLSLTDFETQDGTKIDPADYLVFIVKGNSMKFCHIHDGDLIFVAKGFRIVNLKEFPCILVIRRHSPESGKSEYKIRRAWKIAKYNQIDGFENEIREIISSEAFDQVRRLQSYRGDEAMIKDFRANRLPMYRKNHIDVENPDPWNETVVISTTFDTKEEFIHFSIHPIGNIVGIVKDAFTVGDKQSTDTKIEIAD